MTSVWPYQSIVPSTSGRDVGPQDTFETLTITGTLTVDTLVATSTIETDEITEITPGAGVSFPTKIKVDEITEYTLDNGVLFEEMLVRADTLTTPAIDIVSMVLSGAATDIYLALVPKGSGALVTDVPNNAASGGNARGAYSNDFQRARSNADEVTSGDYSVICGGEGNLNDAEHACILGGEDNQIIVDGSYSSILGGRNHYIEQFGSIICAGQNNSLLDAATDFSFIGGGSQHVISGGGNYNAIVCGQLNLIDNGFYCFIGAGLDNECSSTSSGIVAGGSNLISNLGTNGFIGGGDQNTVEQEAGAIPGGSRNTVSGFYGFAMGRRSKANLDGCWTISDSQNADFNSTLADQYNSRYANGYRIIGGKFGLNDRTNHYSDGSTSTSGAVTADLYTIATTTNTTYLYRFEVVGSNATGDTVAFQKSFKVKNVGGVLSVGAAFNNGSTIDAALAGADVNVIVSGTNAIVRVTGVAAQDIGWRGLTVETLYTFA